MKEMTQGEELELSVIQSLKDAGLGKRWARKDLTLASKGETGKRLAAEIRSKELVDLVKKGWGIWIVGDGKDAYEVQALLARGLLLNGVGVRVVGLSYLLKMAQGESDDWMAVSQAQMIAIRGFYDPVFGEPLSSNDRYLLDMMLRNIVEDGRALCLQTAVEPDKCAWWSPTLISLIKEQSAVYLYGK